ncbi:hypothetical protein F5888DRAFT_1202390 [Russula emetica]|nr:hypothetical protein F5888DRAFT_1202390 [Russula emetica]
MKRLIDSRKSYLYYALVCGFNELTNFFIDVGKTLSVRADEHRNFNPMQLLLEHGVSLGIHSYFETVQLHVSSYQGDAEVVQSLLPHNNNVDARNRHGTDRTSLHFTSINGRPKVARPSWIMGLMPIRSLLSKSRNCY